MFCHSALCVTPKTHNNVQALLHYALFHSRFLFFSPLYACFGYQHVGIQNVSENASETRENVSILHYAFGKTRAVFFLFSSHVFKRLRLPKRKSNAECNIGFNF